VLLPTDTVYGVAADAFTPTAVTGLLAAKNRGRTMPVPVLIGEASTLAGLVLDLPDVANRLAEAFWPGGLTLVLSPLLLAALTLATLLTAFIVFDGETTWLEGLALLGLYLIIAASVWYGQPIHV